MSCSLFRVLFINNAGFTWEQDDKVKRELLAHLKDKTQVISTRAYCSNRRPNLTDRHIQTNDLLTILDVGNLGAVPASVSWTNNNVPFYIHKVNRAKVCITCFLLYTSSSYVQTWYLMGNMCIHYCGMSLFSGQTVLGQGKLSTKSSEEATVDYDRSVARPCSIR